MGNALTMYDEETEGYTSKDEIVNKHRDELLNELQVSTF
jgi:hypothetical protein